MYCPKCKAALSTNNKFCTRCGTRIEAGQETQTITSAPAHQEGVACIKCGAVLRPGAKFCPKCGSNQGPQTAQNTPSPTPAPQNVVRQQVQTPVQQTPVQQAPARQTPAQQAPAKKSVLPIVIIVVLLMIALLVGGYFVLDRVFDINPIAMITGDKDADEDKDKDDKDKDDKDKDEDEDSDDESDSSKDSEKKSDKEEKVDPEILNALEEQIETARKAYDEESYENAIKESKAALNRYLTLSESYVLDEETEEQIKKAYNIASKAAIAYCRNIEKQEYGSAGYAQVHGTVDPILELAEALSERGFKVDSADITEYSDGIVQRFKDIYIIKINEITERAQWSRDEAWTYAEQAYSIQENGKTVLFDESELDDPLRLRYVYCLAWIQRKRCENGVADGSMSNEEAFNNMIAILEETDYNLLVLQDIITYGSRIGVDVSGYQAAYNAIVQKLNEEQGLSIVTSGVNSGTSVDVRKFWYFNDLSGDDVYKVDSNNGTTQATRDWIRDNIPFYIN